jgi:hypothetical protein
VACRSSAFPSDAPRTSAQLRDELLSTLRARLAPGRYTSGHADTRSTILKLVAELEQSVASNPPAFPADLGTLDGSWDLVFTTNAISVDQDLLRCSLSLPALGPSGASAPFGGLSAGLPTPSPLIDGSPLRTRRVRQEIDVSKSRVRNCVTITAWPEGTDDAPLPPLARELLSGLEGSDLTLTLDHAAIVETSLSARSPARLRIELEEIGRTLELGNGASRAGSNGARRGDTAAAAGPGGTAAGGASSSSSSSSGGLGASLLGLVPKQVRVGQTCLERGRAGQALCCARGGQLHTGTACSEHAGGEGERVELCAAHGRWEGGQLHIRPACSKCAGLGMRACALRLPLPSPPPSP